MEASPHQTCLQELPWQMGHVQSLFAVVYVHLIIRQAETLWPWSASLPQERTCWMRNAPFQGGARNRVGPRVPSRGSGINAWTWAQPVTTAPSHVPACGVLCGRRDTHGARRGAQRLETAAQGGKGEAVGRGHTRSPDVVPS